MNLSVGKVVSVTGSSSSATLEVTELEGDKRTLLKNLGETPLGKEGDILAYRITFGETDFIYNLTHGTCSRPTTRFLDSASALALMAAFLLVGLMVKIAMALAICSMASLLLHFLYERPFHGKALIRAQSLADEYRDHVVRSREDRSFLPAA